MASLSAFLSRQLLASLPEPKVDLTGQTVIVTGSNVGLGKEAARYFVRLGASTVILAVRSISKGEAAKADIEKTEKKTNVIQVWQLDMSSYESVLDFVDRATKELDRIDSAVLNAGVVRTVWEIMEQDESTITVNVVSTYLLALSLLPKLKETAAKYNKRPNLTVTASDVHYWAQFTERNAPEGKLFEVLSEKPAKPDATYFSERYNVSKLLEVLMTRAIADRQPAAHLPVTVNCVSPGLCHSELAREGGIGMVILKFLLARSTAYGSRTLVHAGTAGAETHGQFLSECAVQKPSDYVLSSEGYEMQDRVFKELTQKLEGIKPGVTAVLDFKSG